MPESTETRALSGLARSIDALFAAAPPTVTEHVSDAPATLITPASPREEPGRPEETLITRPPSAVLEVPRPRAPEMFPATQMIEAVDVETWIEVQTPSAPGAAAGAAAGATSADTLEAEPNEDLLAIALDAGEPTEGEVLEIAPAPREPAEDEVLEIAPAAAESSGEGPVHIADETETFARAVEAFLAGEPGARESLETLAAGLAERLALDPLADAVERLVRVAGDPPDPRLLDAAGSVINPAVASRLVQRMGKEPDEASRAEYLSLCRRLGRVMANAVKGALTGATEREVRRVYYDALIAMGETSRPVIEGMVEDENRFLVRDAVAILGEIGGARAVELVTSALANTDARVRAEALLALAKLGDAEAGQLVLGFLDDPDVSVRLAAAVAAGELTLERALRPLLGMLDGEQDPKVCIPLLRALGQIGDPGAVHAIEKHAVATLFSKPRTDVRIAAYRALHEIGTPRARELIKQTARDKDPGVRVALRDLARAG